MAPMSASSSQMSAQCMAWDRCGHPTATASPTNASATTSWRIPPHRAFEQHEVVLLTVNEDDPLEPAGTQVVIPPPQTTGPLGQPIWWYP